METQMETEEPLDLDEICKEMRMAVVQATKCANQLPTTDFAFYNDCLKFNKVMQIEGKTCISLMSDLLKHEHAGKSFDKINDDDDKFDVICDLNDTLLDRIGNNLDEAAGLKRKDAALVMATLNSQSNSTRVTQVNTASWNQVVKARRTPGVVNLLTAKTIERPQNKFKDKINNSDTVFIPKIEEKPNSIKPLALLPEVDLETGLETYAHPYETEIEKLKPSDEFFKIVMPVMPQPVSQTPFKYIANKDDLIQLCNELRKCKEIAVDLEHHSYRTYLGFTCLMQISSWSCDYIVDTLELRNDLHLLNEVFTSPSILKVFHGADSDIVWLQRDFGIYVVNMFDTGQAARVLNFPHMSLAYLMKHYCKIELNKQFQLADWRIRPLTDELIKYAREDTHYLLFIYEIMKSELIVNGNLQNNLLFSVFERCKTLCLKKYEKPHYSLDNIKLLMHKSRNVFNSKQNFALKELYAWRDRVARIEDESTGYVLPNHMLLKIAEVLPREQQGILACCNPIPPLVKQQLNEIHKIILKARDSIPIKMENTIESQSLINNRSNTKSINLDESHVSRHDTAHLEVNHHLPTLLDNEDYEKSSNISLNGSNLNGSHFFQSLSSSRKEAHNQIMNSILTNFITPYERYKLALEKMSHQIEQEEDMSQSIVDQSNTTADDSLKSDNISRVYSHFLELSDVPSSSTSNNDQLIASNSGHSRLEHNQEHVNKKRKIVKQEPDIPCNTLSSIKSKLDKMKEGDSQANQVTPFDYSSYDYSKFSAPSTSSSKSTFNPYRTDNSRSNWKNKKGKNNNQKKGDKSSTFGNNSNSRRKF